MNDRIMEKFADAQHEIWAHWMKYLFTKGCDNTDGSFRINGREVERWKRQMETSYDELSEEEKQSDRDVITEHMNEAFEEIVNQFENEMNDILSKA